MDHGGGTNHGRSSRDRHVSGAQVCERTRKYPQVHGKGPVKTRFSRAIKWAFFARCSAENGRPRLERGRFRPLCDRCPPFFARKWLNVCVCWRREPQEPESKRSLDDLNDLRTFFGRPNLPRSARLYKSSQIEAFHHFLTSQGRSWTNKQCWGLL